MKTFLVRYSSPIIIILLSTFSVITWYYSYSLGLSLAYNDAMSHLNLTRFIVDSHKTGLGQMGGVWLPMHRIVQLPFIWHDYLWKTGLAGSLISMASYVISVVTAYAIGKDITKKHLGGWIAALVIAVNANFIYLQTTPLTEPLFLAFFLLAMLSFLKWIHTDHPLYLCALSFFTFLQVLTRYDGWFVAIITATIVFGHQLLTRKEQLIVAFGKTLMFLTPCVLGISVWLLWEAIIFGDPLYFARSEFSAKSQQTAFAQAGELRSQFNIIESGLTYFNASAHNVGLYILVMAHLGILYYLFERNFKSVKEKLWILSFLFAPIIFNILALFLGFSVIFSPHTFDIPKYYTGDIFNIRYGIFALPLVAILFAIVMSTNKKAAVLGLLFLCIQTASSYYSGIITVIDGTRGKSAFIEHETARNLKPYFSAHSDSYIVMSAYINSPIMFKNASSLKNIIHEGTDEWQTILSDNTTCTYDVYIARKDNKDPVNRIPSESCSIAYEDDNVRVFVRNPAQQQATNL